jgi:pimeloyl-ACP methyl ester carboxylesterase
MGGGITTAMIQKHPQMFDGAMLLSPMLDFDTGLPSIVGPVVLDALEDTDLGEPDYEPGKGPWALETMPSTLSSSPQEITRLNAFKDRFRPFLLGGPTKRWGDEAEKACARMYLDAPKLADQKVLRWYARNDRIIKNSEANLTAEKGGVVSIGVSPSADDTRPVEHETLMGPQRVRHATMRAIANFMMYGRLVGDQAMDDFQAFVAKPGKKPAMPATLAELTVEQDGARPAWAPAGELVGELGKIAREDGDQIVWAKSTDGKAYWLQLADEGCIVNYSKN